MGGRGRVIKEYIYGDGDLRVNLGFGVFLGFLVRGTGCGD